MAFKTNRIQVDGSINIDGSIFQWQELFSGGGGGGGTGDVAWASGDVGLNNEIITAAGDGSIISEENLTYNLGVLSVKYGAAAGLGGEVIITNNTGAAIVNNAAALGFNLDNLHVSNSNVNAQIKGILPASDSSTTDLVFSVNDNTSLKEALRIFGSTRDISIASALYMNTGERLYFGTSSIRDNAAELTLVGGSGGILLATSAGIEFDPLTGISLFNGVVRVTGDVSVFQHVKVGNDLFVDDNIYNTGMDPSIKNNIVYYDTGNGQLTYGAPAAADISTLSIESYVNSSSYYDASIKNHFFPNPSTGLGNTEAQGLYAQFVAGEAITAWRGVHMNTDGKVYMADADVSSGMPAIALSIAAVSSGATGDFLIYGVVRNTGWAFNIGKPVYIQAGTSLDGQLTSTMPSGTADVVQVVGIATSPDSLIWNPSVDFVVI